MGGSPIFINTSCMTSKLSLYDRYLTQSTYCYFSPFFRGVCFLSFLTKIATLKMRFGRSNIVHVAVLATIFFKGGYNDVNAFSMQQPKGSAATPFQKKKIAVVGGGGYFGGLVFGFLQRACSLYGTGMGSVRCIGATSDTAVRMNRLLGKNFCLAVADEMNIKLTDLQSVDALQQSLEGFEAVIWGTEVSFLQRSVTAGTYDKSPNQKAMELYWGAQGGAVGDEMETTKESILENLLQASRQAGVKHMVVVQDDASDNWLPRLEQCGIPFTFIRPAGKLLAVQDYTYRKGIQGSLSVSSVMPDDGTSTSSSAPSSPSPVCTEDVAALCVQCLQSLDWTKSRCVNVSCNGALNVESLGPVAKKRPDEEWCVRSSVLEDALTGIL
jgi:hypothetical protein